MIISVPEVAGLSAEERELFDELYKTWCTKLSRNRLKMTYYNQKNALNDLGISIPPELRSLDTVLGWPAKAVNMLASRSRFDGFATKNGKSDEIERIMRANRLGLKYRKAVQSQLIHSCAFFTVSKGAKGEPGAVISVYSAETAAATYDYRKDRIKAGMCVVDVDAKTKEATWINLYTNDAVIEMTKRDDGKWNSNRLQHEQGRPLMEPVMHNPTLTRPFGTSRISRAVIALTDSAMRTCLRSEVTAEFFTAPQKYLFGIDKEVFDKLDKWQTYIGNLLTATKDEDGGIPQFGQLPQGSMQPHSDYLRSLAMLFAGETGIPVSALGIIHDNPASAEAMYAASEELIVAAEDLNDVNGDSLSNVAMLALAISRNTTIERLDEADKGIVANFKNPMRSSLASRADAMSKVVSMMPWVGNTSVALKELGFSDADVSVLMSEKRIQDAMGPLSRQGEDGGKNRKPTMYEVTSLVKSYKKGALSRATALDQLVDIGVEEKRANQLLDNEIPPEAVAADEDEGAVLE